MIDEQKLLEQIVDFKRCQKSTNCDYLTGYISALSAVEGMIADQPKVGEWIPCSKELPSESGYYFACIHNLEVDDFDFRKTWFAHVDDYDIEESEWRELYDCEKVTAWQPLPEPYKAGDT